MTTKTPTRSAPAEPGPRPGIHGTLKLTQIRPSPTNPRQDFAEASLRELAESIRVNGLFQPVVVRPIARPGETVALAGSEWRGVDYFELVVGERRYRAVQLLGWDTIPVSVTHLTDEQVLVGQIVENDQRDDVKTSERVVAYTRLASRADPKTGQPRTAERIAAETGKSLSDVRKILALAKLPAWALQAIDRGWLEPSAAEAAARVFGERSRAQAAYCILAGLHDPHLVTWTDQIEFNFDRDIPNSLTVKDAREMVQTHFSRQLKGAPFSRKSLTLVPEAGSCDDCPQRAGNNAEATAEGVRADTCLDPACYAKKVEAYRTVEVAKAVAAGMLDASELVDDGSKDWCQLEEVIWKTALAADFPVGPNQDPKREEPLLRVLGKHCPQRYVAFDLQGKVCTLVKTAEARQALRDMGVLKKPERARAEPQKPAPASGKPPANGTAGKPPVSEAFVERMAIVTAAKILGEYSEEQFTGLEELADATAGGVIVEALRLVCRAQCYTAYRAGSMGEVGTLQLHFPGVNPAILTQRKHDETQFQKIESWPAPKCLAFLIQLAAASELYDRLNSDIAQQLLDFAELDWEQLKGQARRELSGEESVDEKIKKVEAVEDWIEKHPGEYIGDLGVLGAEIDKSSITGKDWKKAPVGVQPFRLDGRLWVSTGCVLMGEGNKRTWECVPLFERGEFEKKFRRRITDRPELPANPTDKDRDNYYWGVRVKYQGQEYVLGSPDDERKLTTVPQLNGKAKAPDNGPTKSRRKAKA